MEIIINGDFLKTLKIASLFSGCGGLDLGFEEAGFKVVFANDIDKGVWETYEKNHGLIPDKRSIAAIPSSDIPNVIGIIGGPPCQSWSLAGAMRGVNDPRGQLFYEYVRVLRDKQPAFFLAENVPGIISKTHVSEFEKLLNEFREIGYEITYDLLDARNYGVPQERKRVIIVGYLKSLNKKFVFPAPSHTKEQEKRLDGSKTEKWVALRQAIGDLPKAKPALDKNKANAGLKIPNHEYMNGGFSTIYMSRNRRRKWGEQSFTIQAGGRHAPLHPDSCEMLKKEKDWWVFSDNSPGSHRRLSVRECARIQTFPDDFVFYYDNVAKGYKMIGNAVPVKLAGAIARQIISDLVSLGISSQ